MRVRQTKIAGLDLNLFEFDYDLTFACFFLNADGHVYGRYGSRDARSAEDRQSLAGLRHALLAALAAHKQASNRKPPAAPPRYAEQYPAAKKLRVNECIHCHQVYEFQRAAQKEQGTWDAAARWVYPLPETVGLTLDVDQGNRVRQVQAGSPAARLGLRAGDVLLAVNEVACASQADVQYGLHKAPAQGKIAILWQRGNSDRMGQLELSAGWRRYNLTWRPSLLDVLPSLALFGDDLTAAEKKALGLDTRRLAFRQDPGLSAQARQAGVEKGDVVIGLDGKVLEMTVTQFLGHVRQNYLTGDRVTLNIIRDGKRLDLPMTLR